METGRGAWAGLAVLFGVYTLNFLDRTLIYVVFRPIKAELVLTDLQLALLGSTAFVLFYTALGIPFGRLADRVRRTWMIAAGLAAWTLASAATGLAPSFFTLLLCRIGVGIGEATLGPAAYSLLADWFPSDRRATASALFSAGIPLGAGLAMALGGVMSDAWGWRSVFPALALPGLVLVGAVLALPEPRRGAVDPTPTAPEPSLGSVLRGSKVLRFHLSGYALLNVGSAAWSLWLPTYLSARFGRPLAEVGPLVGMGAVVGGLTGTVLGGWIADRLRRSYVGGRLAFGAGGAAASALAWLALLAADDFRVAVGCSVVGMGLALAWLGPASADIQDLAPRGSRATAISAYYLAVNLAGYGVGPPVIGAIDDWLGVASHPERMAWALTLCPAACLVAAGVLAMGAAVQQGQSRVVASEVG